MLAICMAISLITPQRVTVAQYVWIAAQMVEAMQGAVATDADPKNVRGPLFVDIRSIVATGVGLVADTVREKQIIAAIRVPFVAGDSANAVRCVSRMVHCTVKSDGMFLQLDRAWFEGGELIAQLSVFWNHRNVVNVRSLCPQVWRVTFQKRGDDWYLTSHELESTC